MDPIVKAIPLTQIHPSPHQARKTFDIDNLRGLAESMKQEGLLNPVVVRRVGTHFELISGERRLRAAKLLGWHALEAKVIGTVSEAEAAAKGMIENIQREDLNTIEEAEGYRELNRLDPKYWTQNKIAQNCGKTQGHVSEFLRFLTLPDVVKGYIRRRILSAGHAAELIRLHKPSAQKLMTQQILRGKWSVMQTREAVDRKLGKRAAPKSEPGVPVKLQDPLFELWETLKNNPQAALQSEWEVIYGPRKVQSAGDPIDCWMFVVPNTEATTQSDLARWFRRMAEALEGPRETAPAIEKAPEPSRLQGPENGNGNGNGNGHHNDHANSHGNGHGNSPIEEAPAPMAEAPADLPKDLETVPEAAAATPRVTMMLPASASELQAMTRERENMRLPKDHGEERTLEALAYQGPLAVYQWIYGENSVTARKVTGRTWAELGVNDPAIGVRGMLRALKRIKELSSY